MNVVQVDDHLIDKNKDNYGNYAPIIDAGYIEVDTRNFNIDEIDHSIDCILNIFKDGIYLDKVQSMFVGVHFADGVKLDLSLEDYVINLIFWKLTAALEYPITSECVFYNRSTTTGYIGKYINRMYIKKYINKIKNNNIRMTSELLMEMNVTINDVFETFTKLTPFQMYLNNTLCLEDTLDMMNKYPDFNETMHLRLAGVPLEELSKYQNEAVRTQINYITGPESNHCLKYFFLSGEGVAEKQYGEVACHIGVKPNGEGGIIPAMIDSSYLNGGLSTPEAYAIDASASRVAQIMSHENVGRSGDFARILELNSLDTILYPDSRYKCDTKNTIRVKIENEAMLYMYDRRYYRFAPIIGNSTNDRDKIIDADTDKWLIGRTIELYSPMTCASNARGEGVCYRCYGDLAYTNSNINIGIIASEILSSIYTQRQLSAKHILKAKIVGMNWSNPISGIFDVSYNTIKCYNPNDDEEGGVTVDYTGMNLIINAGDIDYEDTDDELEYNMYTTRFLIDNNGDIKEYSIADGDLIYISEELIDEIAKITKRMKNYNDEKDDIVIPLKSLENFDSLFKFHINNDDLSKTINSAKAILNKSKETSKYTKDEILSKFVNVNMEGGITLNSVHYEVIIANQIRDKKDKLLKPDWSVYNPEYEIWTLDKSLLENPAVTVSLQYRKIVSQTWKPISFIKKKASGLDLFFMDRPQDVIKTPGLVADKPMHEEFNDVGSPAVKFRKIPKTYEEYKKDESEENK